MKIIKLKDGKITLVNERGVSVGVGAFGREVVSAFFNDKQDLIVTTLKSGKVETLNERGVIQKIIVNTGAVNARFAGDDIVVETTKGKTELRSQTGVLKKTL
jgi:hypothetical protein